MLIAWLSVALVGYVLGSIPSGLMIGRLVFGVDVRDYGSHRTGATNVLRTLGKKAAVAALVMDMAKGALAVAFARWMLPAEPWAHVAAAVAATIGHNWPVFVGFRGGRGVIVSAAAIGVMHLPVLLLLTVVGLSVVWRTRYVSLGSILGALSTPVFALLFYFSGEMPLPYVAFTVLGAILVVASHRDNIDRLLAGTENRLGQRVQPAA